MVRPTRFERVTAWFVARYSIQLSYGRVEGAYYREEVVYSQALSQIIWAVIPPYFSRALP